MKYRNLFTNQNVHFPSVLWQEILQHDFKYQGYITGYHQHDVHYIKKWTWCPLYTKVNISIYKSEHDVHYNKSCVKIFCLPFLTLWWYVSLEFRNCFVLAIWPKHFTSLTYRMVELVCHNFLYVKICWWKLSSQLLGNTSIYILLWWNSFHFLMPSSLLLSSSSLSSSSSSASAIIPTWGKGVNSMMLGNNQSWDYCNFKMWFCISIMTIHLLEYKAQFYLSVELWI